jgi:hypothetical protein
LESLIAVEFSSSLSSDSVLSFRAMSNSFSNPTPQFGTAEYVGTPGGDHCQFCHQPIAGNYYRVNGAIACSSCASTTRADSAKDSHAAYTRGLLYGIGAAIAGMILYATFEVVTGIIIGYVSLAVGWMVGKAMMKGSNGVGGRRYQIAAVLLTYAAVSLAAVPVIIHYARNHQRQTETQRQKLDTEQRQLESESGQSVQPPPQQPKMSAGQALGRLALFGLASPFIEVFGNPIGGLIGLFILFIGIRIAARITAGQPAEVFGPFDSSVQPSH